MANLVLVIFILISSIACLIAPGKISIPWHQFEVYPWKSFLFFFLFALLLKKRREKNLRFKDGFLRILPFFSMILFYPIIPAIIQAFGRNDQDTFLHALDLKLFGGQDPLVLLQPWINAPTSEWMAFCYSSYGFLLLILLFWLFLKPDFKNFDRFVFELVLTLCIGYFGYALFPAIGPIYSQNFSTPIELQLMKDFKEATMDQTRIDRDCFPSLHTAITLVVGFHYHLNFKKIFRYILPILISIPFACIYLRYHYVVDVIAGLILGASAIYAGRSINHFR
jgi:membrane-associated phospholipid phosphatase